LRLKKKDTVEWMSQQAVLIVRYNGTVWYTDYMNI